jgi:hypothetical protein
MVGGSVTGAKYVGALVGYNSYGSIENSYATSAVSSVDGPAGGLVGINTYYGTITNSYATGAVSSTNNSNGIGGLVGSNSQHSTISNSHATGIVIGGTGSSSAGVGGLAGQNSNSTITNSYATGAVSGYFDLGGLVGVNSGPQSPAPLPPARSAAPNMSADWSGKTLTKKAQSATPTPLVRLVAPGNCLSVGW